MPELSSLAKLIYAHLSKDDIASIECPVTGQKFEVKFMGVNKYVDAYGIRYLCYNVDKSMRLLDVESKELIGVSNAYGTFMTYMSPYGKLRFE